ncbi:hypothetical protein P4S64_03630 [Vibrio sp. M60_M31a]
MPSGRLGSSDSSEKATDYSVLPSRLSGSVGVIQVDGISDDLLTGMALNSNTGAVTPETVGIGSSTGTDTSLPVRSQL